MAQSNYQVNLLFNANTQQAKAQLQSLQVELNKLTTQSGTGANLGVTLDSGLQKAKASARELQSIMQAATNSQGVLDLSQFNNALKQSGKTLEQFAGDFKALGPAGQQAFQGITRQIVQAQVPIKKTNVMLDKMATTMANTVRWQISASVLQGFISAIQTSYQYAQDLNESLNNIRIVTGYSVDEMDKFAEKANKAAKALSASTTAYTDAALIYYQQGLGDKAVEERTNTTMKLANVTGQSAETVSEWMTSIWNNFDDGSKSLEYYADVITALGAATASSSEEIATGLEKFAAVAETTGLGYEYATAALATVTAETRQSADVVGTAFKTLFARIQDLELGKTLEDGVTTGKYAQALETVGVQVIEANGDLRDMDLILNDLGKRWDTLTNAQQVSLAQTVAGMRQYNQFLALMSNWDVMQQNLLTAQTSEGELTKQQDIWSESWEAANKRVEAAAQDLYDDLIDDDFFIKITDMFAKIIDGVGDLVDAMGGLRGLLPLLISGMTTLFGQKMLMGVREFASNMGWSSKGKAINEAMDIKSGALGAYSTTFNDNSATNKAYKQSSDIQNELMQISTRSTEAEQAKLSYINNQVLALEEQISKREKALALAKEEANIAQQAVNDIILEDDIARANEEVQNNLIQNTDFQSATEKLGMMELANDSASRESLLKRWIDEGTGGLEINPESFTSVKDEDWSKYIVEIREAIQKKIKDDLQQASTNDQIESKKNNGLMENMTEEQELEYLKKEDPSLFTKKGVLNKKKIPQAKRKMSEDKEVLKTYEKSQKSVDELTESLTKKAIADGKVAAQTKIQRQELEEAEGAFEKYREQVNKMGKQGPGEVILGVTQSISSLTMGLSSCVAAFENLNNAMADGNLSFQEFLGFATSLSMGIPMIIGGMKSLVTLFSDLSQQALKDAAANELLVVSEGKLAVSKAGLTASSWLSKHASDAENMSKKQAIPLSIASAIAKKTEAAADSGNVVAKLAHAAANWVLTSSMSPLLVATIVLVSTMLILVGIIRAVIAIGSSLAGMYNKDAIAAEETANKAEALAEAYDKAKESYDALKESIGQYEEALKALDTLTKGTEEWNEAVQKVNDSVLALIDKYPELASAMSVVNGVMTLDGTALDALLQEKNENAVQAQYRSSMGNFDSKLASNKSARTNLIRSEARDAEYDYIVENNILADDGSSYQATSSDKRYNEALDLLEKAYGEDMTAMTDENIAKILSAEGYSEQFIAAIQTNSEEIRKLYDSNKALLQAQNAATDAYLLNAMNVQGNLFTEHYNEGVAKQIRQKYEDEIAAKTSEMLGGKSAEEVYGWNLREAGGAVSAEGRKALVEYLKITTGRDNITEQDLNINDSEDLSGFTFELRDENKEDWGEKQRITWDEMARVIAENEIDFSKYVNTANQIQAAIVEGYRIGNAQMSAIASFAEHGDITHMDANQLLEFQNMSLDLLSENDKGLIQRMLYGEATPEEIMEEKKWTEEQFQQSITDFAKNVQEEAQKYSEYDLLQAQQQQRINAAKATITAGAETLEVSEDALEAYADMLKNTYDELEEGAEDTAAEMAVAHFKMAKGIKTLHDTLEDNADIFADSNPNAIEYAEALGEIKTAIDEIFDTDISANFVEDNLHLIKQMANGSEEALEQLKEALVEDFVLNLDLNESSKQTLLSELQSIADEAATKDIKMAVDLDNTNALADLNKLLQEGKITTDQIKSLFTNMDLSFGDTSITTYRYPSTSVTEQQVWTDGKPGPKSTVVSTNWIDMPWIGDNKPIYEETTEKHTNEDGTISYTSYKQKKGTGIASRASLEKTKGTGDISAKDILTYGLNDSATKDNQKKLEEELERYHEITKIIETYESELERIDILKENAFGAKKLQLIDAEIEKTKELTEAHKKEKEEIESYLASDKDAILQYGVSFDEYGNISNYSEVYANMLAQFNANAASDEAEEAWELFTTRMDKYEETLEQLRDQENALLEDSYKEISLTLERINEKVEHSIELAEDELTVLEHQLERLEDTAFDSAEAIALIGKQAETSMKQWEAYQTGIKETLGVTFSEDEINTILSGGDLTTLLEGKELTADQIEQLREYRDGLLEAESTLREQAATVREEVITSFEEWNEELARGTEQISHQQEMLENYRNIIDIVGKDNLGISDDMLKRMSQVSVNSANNLLAANKSILDANKQAVADAYAEMNSMADPEQRAAFYRDVIVDMEEQLADSESNYMDSWTAALEAALTAFDEQMARITESYSKALGGVAGSLEQLTDQFEKQSELADYYLKDYEKTYEISKLNRQITQSIDESDNVASKQALAALQNELLVYQKEGKQMSDYDLQYLQKKYDLTVAQIALEEAQNAKSQVRLQRDSLGNYGYVYTADQGAVDSAQQSYEDKLYDIQQFMDESMQDLQGRYLELNQQYLDELNSLDKTAEDYKERAAAITAHYQELLGYVAEDMNDMVLRGADLNQQYGTTAKETFNETILGNMYNDLTSFQELHNMTAGAMKLTLNEVNEAYGQWQENVSDVMDLAGTSVEDFGKLVDREAIKINEITGGIAENTEKMKDRMSTAFSETLTAAGNFADIYGRKLASIKNENDQLSNSINHLIAAYSALTDENIQSKVNQKIGEAEAANSSGILGNGSGNPNYLNDASNNINLKFNKLHSSGYYFQGSDNNWYRITDTTSSTSDILNMKSGTDIKLKEGVKAVRLTESTSYSSQIKKGNNTVDNLTSLISVGSSPQQKKQFNNETYVTFDKNWNNNELAWWYKETDIKNNYSTGTSSNGDWYLQNKKPGNNSSLQTYRVSYYDTGGYTGAWGPEGRLAMLHQKEIVLNAHDTKNLLDTVSIVRSIVDQIELSALASQQGIGILRAAAVNNTTDTIQQNVTIEAHFPNATDHNEIEQAFNNLVNDAAQYANRK